MTQQTDQNTGNPPANSGAAPAVPAESEFTKLLNEFEKSTANQPVATLLKELQPVVEYARDELSAKAEARVEGDLKDAVTYLKDDDQAKTIPDKFVQGYLRQFSVDNPEVAQAWENRRTNPNEWKAKLKDAKNAFLEEVKGLPANTVRTELEVAAASVRNQSTAPGQPEKYTAQQMMNMPERQWRELTGQPLR